jgi:hypothetical protein
MADDLRHRTTHPQRKILETGIRDTFQMPRNSLPLVSRTQSLNYPGMPATLLSHTA